MALEIRASAAASRPGDFPRQAGLANAGAWGELHHLSVHVRAGLIHVELEPAARDRALFTLRAYTPGFEGPNAEPLFLATTLQ